MPGAGEALGQVLAVLSFPPEPLQSGLQSGIQQKPRPKNNHNCFSFLFLILRVNFRLFIWLLSFSNLPGFSLSCCLSFTPSSWTSPYFYHLIFIFPVFSYSEFAFLFYSLFSLLPLVFFQSQVTVFLLPAFLHHCMHVLLLFPFICSFFLVSLRSHRKPNPQGSEGQASHG